MKSKNSGPFTVLVSRAVLALALILPLLFLVSQSTPAYAVAPCSVNYAVVNQWNTGFQVNVTITNNTGTAVQGWDLTWTFGPGQSFSSGWNATFAPSGSNMSAANVASHWNGTIAANGGTVAFGFLGARTMPVTIPTNFAVNGVSCMEPTGTNTPAPPTNTPAPPTNTPVPPTNTPAPPTNTPLPPTNTPVFPTNTPAPPTSTPGSGTCSVAYTIVNQWNNGFQANVVISNNSSTTINGWILQWALPAGQSFSSGWNATFSSSGQNVTASNPAGHWNGTLGANGSPTAAFGFQGTHSGTVAVPTTFVLNGQTCGGGTAVPTPTNTPVGPTPTNTPVGPTPTNTPPGPTPTPPPPGTHVANPFLGAQGYINPDYAAQVQDLAAQTGGNLGAQMAAVANYSTAVWMDRIGAITAGRGLRGHLDEALAQQNGNTPLTIMIVIYDLPNRDCAALASNGELLIAENGLNRYKAEYIDPIVDILADPAYSGLRIVTIIEPDSLPNLVTNLSKPKCAEAQSSGAYVEGVRYAINQLHPIPNVYIYLDIAHSGWLGWDSNFNPTVQLYSQVIQGTNAGFNSVDGFVTNTANYTPVDEVYLPDSNLSVGGQPLRSATFYEWNPYFDEADFATALYNAFVNAGFPSGIGMLIDTSRNGWGGEDRPTGASGSTVNAYVNSGRIDRRLHRGNWCNQTGAGIGARPTANPLLHVDAYVWVKPPGESDGISEPTPGGPNEEGKQHDPMCDPAFTASSGYNTGALDNAPHAGGWFPAQFQMLVENAYPPLP
jgi:cellulose 1,4-beta-cellobiosidase